LFCQNDAKLDMSLSLHRPPVVTLSRVRLGSTALKTRELRVDASTLVLQVKEMVESAIKKGEHWWVDEQGGVTRVRVYICI